MPTEGENAGSGTVMVRGAGQRNADVELTVEADKTRRNESHGEWHEIEEEWWRKSLLGRSEIDDEWDDQAARETLNSFDSTG